MSESKICIYQPYLKKYKKSAIDAINSEWISNHGKYVELSTEKLKEILNIKHIILMCNGTAATHCLFISLKYRYPNINKIYLPNNAYVAVYNSALMEYSLDSFEILKIDKNTWNTDVNDDYLLSLDSNSAILICHNLGGIINVDRIKNLRPDIILIEDNCEGIFGKYNGKYTGSSENTLCSSISFYGNKSITSGEGGAFCTQDTELFDHISKVYSQGMSSVRYIHNVHAYNYRMTNIEAAFLYDQLNDFEHILNLKLTLFDNYNKLLEPFILNGKIKLQQLEDNCERGNWMYTIRFVNNKKSINETLKFFIERGIETRPFFYPYNSHYHLKNILSTDTSKNSVILNQEVIMFPSYPTLTFDQQKYIVEKISEFIEN